MSPIARWTLRQRRWFMFWWCAGLVGLIVLTLVFYPTIKSQSTQLDKSFAQIPQTAKQLFTDTDNLFSPVGYLSSQIFYLLLPLLLAILAINLGMSLIGKEERSGTIEMLLARPVSRLSLLLAKAWTGLLIVGLAGLTAAVATAVMCRTVGLNLPVLNIFSACLAASLLALSIGALAFMLAAFGAIGRTASLGIAAVFAVGGYVIASLAASINWLRGPAKLFPFNYYHAGQLLNGDYNWANALYFIASIAIFILAAVIVFRRRDLVVGE